MGPNTLHDYYASGEDPRDIAKEPPMAVCDHCSAALEAGEIDECQLCTNDWWRCPECSGRGYIHGGTRDWLPDWKVVCQSCHGEGRILLSNREAVALELAPDDRPVTPKLCRCGSGYVEPGKSECLTCWGDRQDAMEGRSE
jgi:hypothetical protein